jgi:intracellular multiplication protein IcmO
MRAVRGIEARHEVNPRRLHRDVRPGLEKFFTAISDPRVSAACGVGAAVFAVMMPLSAHALPLVVLIFALTARFSRSSRKLPLRMPKATKAVDFNDPKPGRGGYNKARGIFHLGNDNEGKEIWASKTDLLTHMLVLGATGAGKTESLVSISSGALSMGAGLIYVDAKAAPSLAWQIISLARRLGREDDLLLINYLTGSATLVGRRSDRLSNTTNPFAHGSADALTQILTSMIPPPAGENAVFAERAIALVSAIMYPLVELRDAGKVMLGASTIREYLNFSKVIELANRRDVSEKSRSIVAQYLGSLPNYDPSLPAAQQDPESGRQFGFAQQYFTRSMSSLADAYGHIYWTEMGEVDFRDVVYSRRILVVLLPALEKAPAELANLGKIILSALREAISSGLGSKIEGTRQEVLEALPTASEVPMSLVLDEYGYMAVEGFSVVAAQARGLGIATVYAGQDWSGFKRGSETEAGQVWGNTRIKVIGALEDNESMRMLNEAIGEAVVSESSGYTIPSYSSLGTSYADMQNASFTMRKRIDNLDLQGQLEGQVHILTRGSVIRGDLYYANPKLVNEMRVNRFLKVCDPSEKEAANPAARGPLAASDAGGFGAHPHQVHTAPADDFDPFGGEFDESAYNLADLDFPDADAVDGFELDAASAAALDATVDERVDRERQLAVDESLNDYPILLDGGSEDEAEALQGLAEGDPRDADNVHHTVASALDDMLSQPMH